MTEEKCPGEKLESLVLVLHPMVFETLSDEPERDILEKITRKSYPNISDEELDIRYREFLKHYGKNQRIASELFKYGNTREEILDNLRNHVAGCLNCSAEYIDMLKIYVISDINLKNSKYPVIAALGRKYEKEGFFRLLKERDKEYLDLLS